MNDTTLKQAYKTIDQVIEEVTLDEEQSLGAICTKLQQENSWATSSVIAQIIAILKDWGNIPVSEIKEKALAL